MLARKGYPPGLAYRVVREAIEQDARGSSDLGDMQEPEWELE
jgi:hypothetical protein